MKKLLTFITLMFLFLSNVNAECSYNKKAELNNKAANIKASYEIVEEVIKGLEYDYTIDKFKISIMNVTSDFQVIVKNDFNNSEITYTSNDAVDGIISFEWENINDITNFTIYVYGTEASECVSNRFRTIYLTTPMYNIYSKLEVCKDLTDFSMCKKYISTNIESSDVFYKQLDTYMNREDNKKDDEVNNDDNKGFIDTVIDFANNNKFILIGVLVVLSGGIVTYIIVRRKKTKKQRDLGL